MPGHKGREHHHQAFSNWMAGGGVKAGLSYGSTDVAGVVAKDILAKANWLAGHSCVARG